MNFLDAKTKLADWIGAANVKRLPVAVRGDLINLARRDLCKRDLRFNELDDTVTTVAGTRAYALPARWSRPYQVWYPHPQSGKRVDVEYRTREEFDRAFVNPAVTSSPSHYTVWGPSLLLGPTPDAALTINLTYYGILADLVADTDTDEFLTKAWEVIHYKALAAATPYMLEDSRLALWSALAMEHENKLVVEHTRARSVGRRPVGREPS